MCMYIMLKNKVTINKSIKGAIIHILIVKLNQETSTYIIMNSNIHLAKKIRGTNKSFKNWVAKMI